MSGVRVEGLSKAYGPTRALDDVTLDVPDGSFFGLLGPSGSGKTTLLRAIAGFVAPDRGRVLFDGRPVESVPVERRGIGMVFQSYALFPNMSVARNVAFGLEARGMGGAERDRRVAEALDLVRLGPLAARAPHELSGGQRQRVAMARAIVTRPQVLLLDEPLSALDRSLRRDMQIELRRIQREVGITTVFVTHDQEEALTLSDRIGLMRDGRLIRHGTPQEVWDDPRDAFTAGFLGEANLFEGVVEAEGLRLPDGTLLRGPPGAPTEMIAVRPEHLRVSVEETEARNQLRAHLRQRVFAGATGGCVLDWRGREVRASGPFAAFRDLPETGPVWMSWPAESSAWVTP